jgi:ribosomal protein S8
LASLEVAREFQLRYLFTNLQNRQKMKRILSYMVFMVVSIQINAQTYKTGYIYSNDGEYVSMHYTMRYQKTSPTTYVTIYTIAKPDITITVTHDILAKKVTASTKETHGGILGELNTEEIYYQSSIPKKLFGNEGDFRLLGGDRVPYQFAVKFLPDKFVNVKSVLGANDSYGYEFFCFNL